MIEGERKRPVKIIKEKGIKENRELNQTKGDSARKRNKKRNATHC